MSKTAFYCPVYEGEVEEYDCSEISTGIHRGRFVNDGIPFLMDIETALSRKVRCQSCARCPEHYRPRGPLLHQLLENLGFPRDIEEMETAIQQVQERYRLAAGYHAGRLRCYQMASGIQLWMEWDKQLDIMHDVQPHYLSANGMYLRPDRIIRYQEAGKMVRGSFTAFARMRIKSDSRLVHNRFQSPNLSAFKQTHVEQEDLVCQVTAFPAKLNCFYNKEDYLKRREVNLWESAFVSGLAMPDADMEDPGSDALLTGEIKEVHVVTNDVTGLPFYHLVLYCLGLVFDVVAAVDRFKTEPKPGNILQGVFWLSARVLDYGYTGYEFEIDVTTPLTAARFEPIRRALENLQPGERIYCGVDPPLGEAVFVRAKGEVEGIGVEFRYDVKDEENPDDGEDDAKTRIFRFYPVSRATAVDMFRQFLVYERLPRMEDAKEVTEEYQRGESEAPDGAEMA